MDNFHTTILKSLANYCSYQERSEYEVILYFQKTLIKLNIYDATLSNQELQHLAQKYIQILQKDGFLNQKRFISAYINGKINLKCWGEKKIIFGLEQHQIFVDDIKKHYDKQKYVSNLESLAMKKWIQLNKKTDAKTYHKVISFLSSKGYRCSEIKEKIKITLSKFNDA